MNASAVPFQYGSPRLLYKVNPEVSGLNIRNVSAHTACAKEGASRYNLNLLKDPDPTLVDHLLLEA